MARYTKSSPPLEGKIPPQNIEAEQSVLGALLLDKEAIIKVADISWLKAQAHQLGD